MTQKELRYVIPVGTSVHVVMKARDGHQIRYQHTLRERLEFRDRGWEQENRERWGFVVKRNGQSFTVWANIADIRMEEPTTR